MIANFSARRGRWVLALAFLLLVGPGGSGFGAGPDQPATAPPAPMLPDKALVETCEPCLEFNRLNNRVRDSQIPRREARDELFRLLPQLRSYYLRNGGQEYGRDAWVFPLQGYSAKAIAGGRRHGYQPKGYDYFDGNRHGGHPSLDIFIQDRNQDERDDRTGQPVPVLSLTGGVVVALAPEWHKGSRLRGGKYLWIYDPTTEALIYYAHNRELLVGLGAIVKPGDPIARVGRTGRNAARKRSPTHLHLTYLKVTGGTLVPENLYPVLTQMKTRAGS